MARRRALTDASVGYLTFEIEERCREAIIAGELLEEWVAADADASKVWLALRSILNAAANISLLVGGPGGARATERPTIRSSLGITKRSPLHNSMLRHDSEHVDDRILRAQHTSDSESGIGYAYGRGRARDLPFLHGYDTSTGLVYFNHREVSIPEILAEIGRILTLLTTIIKPGDVPGLES